MFSRNEKISFGICGIEIGLCVIKMIWNYAESRYCQGRIDTIKEIVDEFVEVTDDVDMNI